jgi:DUF4097 and DUF4098 domain-containing protein YvlB
VYSVPVRVTVLSACQALFQSTVISYVLDETHSVRHHTNRMVSSVTTENRPKKRRRIYSKDCQENVRPLPARTSQAKFAFWVPGSAKDSVRLKTQSAGTEARRPSINKIR